tara:strand:+ start:356 stop:1207 length:852 start_codon:yes stop_codon:yes gene_type:complete
MKTAIIGYGFVGKALANGFKNNLEVKLIDPKLKTKISDLESFNPELVFICVPTPMNNDGTQDISILEKVLIEINQNCPDSLVVIKSTLLPSFAELIKDLCKRLVLNPEFLRENFAIQDFINSDLIIFGGNEKECKYLSKFYQTNTKCINKNHVIVDFTSASLIKYTINSFLATKVIFFNEIKEIFDKSETVESWTNFIAALSLDKRIGNSHMLVPGSDGRYGFGGACFPKDTNALYHYSCEVGAKFELLEKVISLNNSLRAEYTDPTKRELEQNINFNKNKKE